MSGKRPSLADSMRSIASAPADPQPGPAAPAAPVQAPKPAPQAERPAGFYAATRAGKKKITASVDPAIHTRLKILAAKQNTTTEALLSEAVADLLARLDPTGAK